MGIVPANRRNAPDAGELPGRDADAEPGTQPFARPLGKPSAVSDSFRLTPRMWIGWLEFDVLLGDVRSLKQKRSVIRPLVAELQRKLSVSAAETSCRDFHRRAGIGMALVTGDHSHAVDVLDAAERLVAAHPEFELLSVHRGLHRSDD